MRSSELDYINVMRKRGEHSSPLRFGIKRFGVLVGGSSPRIIIDNIHKRKEKSNTEVLLGADRRTLKEERRTTKQSTGLFLPNQRFGVLVGGSSPRIIIDNIHKRKEKSNTEVLLGADRRT